MILYHYQSGSVRKAEPTSESLIVHVGRAKRSIGDRETSQKIAITRNPWEEVGLTKPKSRCLFMRTAP